MDNETRFLAGALEIRSVDGGGAVLAGVAMRYGARAQIGRFSEEFRAGSLVPSTDGVLLNAHHDRSRPLARSPDTMTLVDGADALRIEARLPDTAEARDVAALVRAKVLTGLSIEFNADAEEWEGEHRVVIGARLGAVAVVDRPAYAESSLEARWKAARCRTETRFFPLVV